MVGAHSPTKIARFLRSLRYSEIEIKIEISVAPMYTALPVPTVRLLFCLRWLHILPPVTDAKL